MSYSIGRNLGGITGEKLWVGILSRLLTRLVTHCIIPHFLNSGECAAVLDRKDLFFTFILTMFYLVSAPSR